jgi:hypothetical protein
MLGARQHQIVRMARIARPEPRGQAVEAQVEPESALVRQYRQGGRALRQVGIAQAHHLLPAEPAVLMQALQHRLRRGRGAQSDQLWT